MDKIKKGDIVGRKSYGKDILFTIQKITKKANGEVIAILKGITIRIEADAPISDLVAIEKERVENNMRSLETKLENRIKRCAKNSIKSANIFKRTFSREKQR